MVSNKIFNLFNTRFNEYKNDENAVQMENYMKNIQSFIGVPQPERKKIYSEFKKEYGKYCRKEMTNEEFLATVDLLWNGGYREFRYATQFFIEYCKQFISLENFEVFTSLIIEGGWWDTTDALAQHVIGVILQNNFEKVSKIIKKWTKHENLWIRRSTILCQLKQKENTNTDLLSYVVIELGNEEEFFIQKAIGWALREYSKTDPKWVKKLLDNQTYLSNLAIREASKYLK